MIIESANNGGSKLSVISIERGAAEILQAPGLALDMDWAGGIVEEVIRNPG